MQHIQDIANQKAYPGRFLIVNNTKEITSLIYGVTARSAASKAKRYVFNAEHNIIHVQATDEEVMAQGDLSLLDYTAGKFFEQGIVLGNGRQTEYITALDAATAVEQLNKDLSVETFEPDKYSTPRITACLMQQAGDWSSALHIIRNDGNGNSLRDGYAIDLTQKGARFISTYGGPNTRPTPSFVGGPIALEAMSGNEQAVAETVYAAFAPRAIEADDLRVSVLCVQMDKVDQRYTHAIVNAVD